MKIKKKLSKKRGDKKYSDKHNKKFPQYRKLLMCWPTTRGHGLCAGVWLIYPVPSDTPLEKNDFSLCQQVLVINRFLGIGGTKYSLPTFGAGIPSGLKLCTMP